MLCFSRTAKKNISATTRFVCKSDSDARERVFQTKILRKKASGEID